MELCGTQDHTLMLLFKSSEMEMSASKELQTSGLSNFLQASHHLSALATLKFFQTSFTETQLLLDATIQLPST